MPQPWPGAISGAPGTRWRNDSGKVRYQLRVSFANSCGQCVQYAGQISTYWNVPFHRNCNCVNVPIPPGVESQPFVDYWKEVEALDPSQKSRVVGKAALTLIDRGIVSWEDVVTRSRIRTLSEVVASKRLSVEAMVKAGVTPRVAAEAHAIGNVPGVTAPPRSQLGEAYRRLRGLGLSDKAIAARLADKVGGRMGIGPGPDGSGATGPISVPATPPVAAKSFGDDRREMSRWSKAAFGGWARGLSGDERDALVNYAGYGSDPINRTLRYGPPTHRTTYYDEVDARIVAIDSAIAKGSTPEAIEVWRSIDRGALGADVGDLGGATIVDRGFVSTTLSRGVAEAHKSDGDLVRIRVPAGTPAASMEAGIGQGGEREILLPRGSRLKIGGARRDHGRIVIDAEWDGIEPE